MGFFHLPIVVLQEIGLVTLRHANAAIVAGQTRRVVTTRQAFAPCFDPNELDTRIVKKAGKDVTEAEIIEFCKANMASYKYPRFVEFRDSLPMTATGKILKRELR